MSIFCHVDLEGPVEDGECLFDCTAELSKEHVKCRFLGSTPRDQIL